MAAGAGTPPGRAAVPDDGRGSEGNPGGTAVGARGGAGPPRDGRHDPGGPRVGEPRADQRRRRRRGRRPLRQDYAGPGEPSNLDLLRAAVALVEGLGRVPATTTQARRILGVPFGRRLPFHLQLMTIRRLRRAIRQSKATRRCGRRPSNSDEVVVRAPSAWTWPPVAVVWPLVLPAGQRSLQEPFVGPGTGVGRRPPAARGDAAGAGHRRPVRLDGAYLRISAGKARRLTVMHRLLPAVQPGAHLVQLATVQRGERSPAPRASGADLLDATAPGGAAQRRSARRPRQRQPRASSPSTAARIAPPPTRPRVAV